MKYEDAQSAFLGELARLVQCGHRAEPIVDPLSPASEFGATPKESIERIGVSFSISMVDSSILLVPGVPFDLEFGVGLLLWTLAASEDQDWLRYYQDDFCCQNWAPWGPRLFGNTDFNQFDLAADLIGRDPGTRRAFLAIHDARHLRFPELGVPCAAGFQVFKRAGRLDAVGIMRAQNALSSLPADLFVFSHLLILLGDKLDLKPGNYTHMCTTFHIFQEQVGSAKELIDNPGWVRNVSLGDYSGFSDEALELIYFERRIRESSQANRRLNVDDLLREIDVRFSCEVSVNLAKVLIATSLRWSGGRDLVGRLELSEALVGLLRE